MTNSQLTIYPRGLVAQWIEHCTTTANSWVRILFKSEFLSSLIFQLLKLKAHCENHKLHSCLSAVHIYDFHIFIIYNYSYKDQLVCMDFFCFTGYRRTGNWVNCSEGESQGNEVIIFLIKYVKPESSFNNIKLLHVLFQSVNNLEEENQLLKNEINSLRESVVRSVLLFYLPLLQLFFFS